MIFYIEAPCMTISKNDLETDFTCIQKIARLLSDLGPSRKVGFNV